MSAMSSDMALEELDREKHRDCDRWGHCKPTAHNAKVNRTVGELAIWLLIALAAVWMLAQFGIVRP